jgi:hypothetical protein
VGGLATIVRFLFVLVVLRFLFRAAASLFRPREAAPKVKPSADLVRDRVCNTFVPQDRALRADVGGKAEYFCSAACRDRALLQASPAP